MAHACFLLQLGGRQVQVGESGPGRGTPRICQEAHSPPTPARHLFGSGLEEQRCLPLLDLRCGALSFQRQLPMELSPISLWLLDLQNLQVPILVDKLLSQEK